MKNIVGRFGWAALSEMMVLSTATIPFFGESHLRFRLEQA